MADAITGGPLANQYTRKKREYWLKYETGSFWHCDEKSFFKHNVPQHRRQKLVTEMYHKFYSSPKPRWWSSWQQLALFPPSQTCIYCVTCRLRVCADATNLRDSLLVIRKGILDWKHTLERLRSHEHPMARIAAMITFSCRCN